MPRLKFHRRRATQARVFSDDQTLKYGDLCVWLFYVDCASLRIFRCASLRWSGARTVTRVSLLQGQNCLVLNSIDDIEHYAAFEHFSFEISRRVDSLGGLRTWNRASCCLGGPSAADALVHHCETIARKRRVIHRAQRESRRRVETSATASRYAKTPTSSKRSSKL
jgi:hypothetical protein